jgi:hypothetical protein
MAAWSVRVSIRDPIEFDLQIEFNRKQNNYLSLVQEKS